MNLFFGDLDPKISIVLRGMLTEGCTLIDVGANVGVVALQCLPWVGKSGRIVAIEPQAECCSALTQSIERNGICNVEVHEVALSDRSGRMELALPDPENKGRASLEHTSRDISGKALVDVRHGSEFLRSLDIVGEYSVKIDVEGHEGHVICGLMPYFREHAPTGILFETNAHKYGDCDFFENPAIRILFEEGFHVFEIPKAFFRLTLAKVVDRGSPPSGTDFVALRPEASERIVGFSTNCRRSASWK